MSKRRERRRNGTPERPWKGRLLATAGIAAFAVMAGGYLGLRGYLHGENFRRFLSAEASEALKADGRFGRFRWDGLQLDTESFEASDGGKLQHLRADRLHTEIGFGGLRRGVWELRGSEISRLDVSLDTRGGSPVPGFARPPSPDSPDTPLAKPKSSRWLPSEVELQGLTVREFTLRALLEKGLLAAEGLQVRLEPAGPKDAWRATIEGGRIATPWRWAPPVRLDRVKARWQDDSLFLTSATATVWKSGRLEADGEWIPRTGIFALQGGLTDIDCAELLDADWAKRLTGRAESSFTVESRRDGPAARGRLQLHDGVLTALPLLDSLAAYADTRRFRVLPLNDARADWEYGRGTLTFRDLVLSSEGLVRIEGTLAIRDRQLDGTFRLGLAPGTLARIPGAETDVFLPGERGLLWAPLRLTGTLDDPKEDLTDRLVAAAGARMFEILPETGQRVLKYTGTALAEAAPEVIDKGTEAIEKGLEKGVKAIDKADDLLRGVNRALDGLLGEEPAPPPQPPVAPPGPGEPR